MIGVSAQAEAFLPIALAKLTSMSEDDLLDDCLVDVHPLFNYREKGYVITIQPDASFGSYKRALRIFFAEDRSSDDFFLWAWVILGSFSAMTPSVEEAVESKSLIVGPFNGERRLTFEYLDFRKAIDAFEHVVMAFVEAR
jgi:hypothetical protein